MLRTRLPHLWIAMIAITFVISGCGQPTRMPSSTPSQPPVTDTFSPIATATQTPTDTPRPSPTITPLATRTPTPIPVEPGEWLVQAVNFGEFLIEYTPRSSSVSLTSVEFSGFQCDNLGIDGKWLPDSHTSKVVDGRFEMSGRITGYMELSFNTPPGAVGVINFPDVVIKGVISDSWELLNGTWEVTWEDVSCTGDWQTGGEALIVPTQPEEIPEPYYLYPFCQCQEEIPSDRVPILRWGWLTTSETYTTNFINGCHTTLYIDGIPYQGLDHLWGDVVFSEEDRGYKSLWAFPLPSLSPGTHRIDFFISLDQSITDGYDADGDNQLDIYGPGEVFSGWVEISVTETTGQPYAACPNNAPAGHWELIVEKESPGEAEITINGELFLIRSGKNVIYLTSNESHTIISGSITTNFSAPECGWNTLLIN